MYNIIQFLLLIVFVSGCSNSNSNNSPLQVNMSLRDVFGQESNSYIQGENIEFFLTATNNTDQKITLNFNNSKQYDFYVTSESGAEIWRWSDNKVFGSALSSITILSGDTVAVNETWNQTLWVGGNIAIGSYTALGSFLEQSPMAQFSFTIQ